MKDDGNMLMLTGVIDERWMIDNRWMIDDKWMMMIDG